MPTQGVLKCLRSSTEQICFVLHRQLWLKSPRYISTTDLLGLGPDVTTVKINPCNTDFYYMMHPLTCGPQVSNCKTILLILINSNNNI